jgi:hypothetical protein
MAGLLGLLLVLWLAMILVGLVVQSLFWLVIVGTALFLTTAAIGWVKGETPGRR